MHIIGVVDTMPNGQKPFLEWCRRRALHYPPLFRGYHSANFQPRVLQFYDFVVPEQLEYNITRDLSSFPNFHMRKVASVVKYLKWAMPLKPVMKAPRREWYELKPNVINGWAMRDVKIGLLGKIKDDYWRNEMEKGREMI